MTGFIKTGRRGKLHTYLLRYANVAGKAVNVNEPGDLIP